MKTEDMIKTLKEQGYKIEKDEVLIFNEKKIKIVDENIAYKDLISGKAIPKGFRILKSIEAIELINSKKLDWIIDKYKKEKFALFAFEQIFKQNKHRFAGLYSVWDLGDGRLYVDGDYWSDGRYGYAFGVFIEK